MNHSCPKITANIIQIRIIQNNAKYKGGTDWEHDVDAIMRVENRAGTMEKNRFAGGSDESVKFF